MQINSENSCSMMPVWIRSLAIATAKWSIWAAALCVPTAARTAAQPIYQGRAIFEEVNPARVPPLFVGRWEREKGACRKRDEPNELDIKPSKMKMAGIGMQVRYVAVKPSQRPYYDHAIVGVQDGAGERQTFILHSDGPDWLVINRRGKARKIWYRRCL
jgi:hypothetical protein